MLPITAYANSSWVWFTQTRPLDLLPIVIVITLAIEIIAVNKFAKVNNLKWVVPVVVLANLVSFLIPYAWIAVSPFNLYSMSNLGEGFFESIRQSINTYPFFTISLFYLFLTLVIETPIVYSFLHKKAVDKKILIKVIIIANTVTTVIAFAIEHIFCRGEW
jgi:hypothetical protein